MGDAKSSARLAATMAIILGSAASPPAQSQSRLTVYSSDLGGPNQGAPTGASRNTAISMGIPRLHALHRRLLAVQATLGNHGMPAHALPPHTHPPPPDDGPPDDGPPDDGPPDDGPPDDGPPGDDPPGPPGDEPGSDFGVTDDGSEPGP